MSWRVAGSLLKLRDQINAVAPNRNRVSDGTIGDTAHQAQGAASDHNPNAVGVVTAMDITNDPASGADVQKIADAIAASRDGRVKYMIFNDRIMVPSDNGWRWVFHYEGSHRQHLHVSVWGNYDNADAWQIGNNKEDDTMIPTADLLNALFWRFRKRHASPAEQAKYVGKISYNDLIPLLNTGDEADRTARLLELGDKAEREGWTKPTNEQFEELKQTVYVKKANN